MSEPAQSPPTGAGATRSRFGAELPLRAAAGVTLMVAALIAAWAGGFWFLAFWLLAAAMVLWEWQTLIGGERLPARLAMGALTLAALSPLALHGSTREALAALAVGAVLTALVAGPDARARFWSGAGVVYAGAIVVSPVLLRGSPAYGLPAILWLYAVVWGADIMAYFGGRLIGGPKLWPRISPGKTWSGAVVGALAGALCGAAVGLLAAPAGARFVPLLLLGLAASVVEELGDLLESAVKRRFHVKDSSHLIPGHGGMMDRLDGFLAAATFAALVGWARASGDWIAGGLFQW
ncbi:MAG TPA: phosphatidate cytidylyltransferase [Roseiarcus sp.]|nr:phosphatidate cytidylyltransferase [Roseiarcus sp.]